MIKKAFTLAEILICVGIISIVIVFLIKTLKPNSYDEKTSIIGARKFIETVDEALLQITAIEKAQCPDGKYLVNAGGSSPEIAIYNPAGTAVISSSEFVTLISKHVKFEEYPINSCTYTSQCTGTSIKGGKLAGGAYIGFEIYSTVADCPGYRNPGDTANSPAPTKFDPASGTYPTAKCWGKFYMDVNGPNKGANTLGVDVYVFGLGENGLAK